MFADLCPSRKRLFFFSEILRRGDRHRKCIPSLHFYIDVLGKRPPASKSKFAVLLAVRVAVCLQQRQPLMFHAVTETLLPANRMTAQSAVWVERQDEAGAANNPPRSVSLTTSRSFLLMKEGTHSFRFLDRIRLTHLHSVPVWRWSKRRFYEEGEVSHHRHHLSTTK